MYLDRQNLDFDFIGSAVCCRFDCQNSSSSPEFIKEHWVPFEVDSTGLVITVMCGYCAKRPPATVVFEIEEFKATDVA